MRKIIALTSIVAIVIVSIYLMGCNNNKSEPQADLSNKEDSLKGVVERGKYLALHVANCLDCHSTRDFTKYSGPIIPSSYGQGGEPFDQKLGVPGIVYAKNITPDMETGIGSWTDDEVMRAMVQGVSKNGDTLFPLMPYYNLSRMAKEDLSSIIAYLRTLKPVKNKVADRKLMVPMSMIYEPKFLQPSIDANVRPPQSDAVKYGEYMTTFADCMTCHTPLTPKGPDMSRAFAGGFVFDAPTFKVVSANITPDSATGIGGWNEERFLNKFTLYRDEKNYNFNPGKQNTYMPMTAYAGMKDEDLKAIYAYLKSLRPTKNLVEKYPN